MTEPGVMPLPDDVAAWVAAYQRATENVSRWKQTADRARQHIVAAMDDAGASIGTHRGRPVVRLTTVISQRVDVAALRRARPDVAEQFAKPVVSQRFSLITHDHPDGDE